MKPSKKSGTRTFEATLERGGGQLKWVIVRIPFDVAKIWGKRGQLRVRGEINGFAFRTSLFPTGHGDHVLLVNKRMQAGAKAGLGAPAHFRLEPDTEKRVAVVPAELERFLAEDPALRRWFHQMNHSMRRYIGQWIVDVKNPDARARRAEQIAERMLFTMEAERELPPIIRAAFTRHPMAFEGWQRMTPLQRRGHLFSVSYYRNPVAQLRRVTRMIRDAYDVAQRKAAGGAKER